MSEPQVDIETLVEAKVAELAQEIYESVQQKTEANERLIAELLMGYQELTTVVQVTIHKLWGGDIEETDDFKKKLDGERRRWIEWMKHAQAGTISEQDLADALEGAFPSGARNPEGT